jgi:hypothetical protein
MKHRELLVSQRPDSELPCGPATAAQATDRGGGMLGLRLGRNVGPRTLSAKHSCIGPDRDHVGASRETMSAIRR